MIKNLLFIFCLASLSFIHSYNNGLAATPPMGWSSWCTNDLCGIFINYYIFTRFIFQIFFLLFHFE
jgi:hypothetical protein